MFKFNTLAQNRNKFLSDLKKNSCFKLGKYLASTSFFKERYICDSDIHSPSEQ